MSEPISFDFALQDPALAIAPVFLVRQRVALGQQCVMQHFGGDALRWEGPALGIPQQSLLLGALSIAGQQRYSLNSRDTGVVGAKLLQKLEATEFPTGHCFAVAKTSLSELSRAAGYASSGGNNRHIMASGLYLLSRTIVLRFRDEVEQTSRLLAWIKDSNGTVTIALNSYATEALRNGQFVKISLKERYALPHEPAKALHAWLSGHMPGGCTRRFDIGKLQTHIWADDATGSTLRGRLTRVRDALKAIDQLPAWGCKILPNGQVEVTRLNSRTKRRELMDNCRA